MAEDPNDPIRQLVHAMWAGVAPQWGEHADQVDSRGPALTERLLDAAAVSTGDRVLELACGPGGAGLAAAERVGLEGEVLLSDVAEEMATIAGKRAAARACPTCRRWPSTWRRSTSPTRPSTPCSAGRV